MNLLYAVFDFGEMNIHLWYFAIVLSHFNSTMNPLIYAYHLKDFRLAWRNFFSCFGNKKNLNLS